MKKWAKGRMMVVEHSVVGDVGLGDGDKDGAAVGVAALRAWIVPSSKPLNKTEPWPALRLNFADSLLFSSMTSQVS